MNLITHLVKTDIRRSRGLLLVWLLLLVLQGLLASFGATPADRGAQIFFAMISQIMPQLEMLLLFVFVPFVVLGDPLVGTTGFWFTRPISRRTLLLSKAIFAGLALVLPAVLVELVVFACNGITLHDIALVVPEIVLERLMLILIVAIIAAISPTFGRFAIVGAAVAVSLVAVELVVSWMKTYAGPGYFVLETSDLSLSRSRTVATALWIILGGGSVVAYQYLTRKTRRSIAAAVMVGILALSVQILWKWDFLAPKLPKSASPLFAVSAVKMELTSNIVTREIMAGNGQGAPDKNIGGIVEPVGLPMGYPVRPKRIKPRLILPDGAALPVKETPRGGLVMHTHAEAFEFALGGTPVVNAAEQTFSTGLFVVDADTFGKYCDQPLTFSADVDCVASKYVITADLPVAKGSRSDRGSMHLAIAAVLRQSDGVDILLRERAPDLIFDRVHSFRPEIYSGLGSPIVYVLRNKKRNEAVLQKTHNYFDLNMPVAESRLVNRTVRLTFGPEPGFNLLTPTLNAEWLADAELIRLDLVPVVEFPTRIVVEKLRLDGKNGFKAPSAEAEPKPAPLPTITLPENADKERVKDYIKEILITAQRRKRFGTDDPLFGMLLKVGARNLDALIDVRCALGSANNGSWYTWDTLGSYLDAAIDRLVRPEDKELILRALPSDYNLAEVVIEKGFQAEARATLMAGLSLKEGSLPPFWIEAVAALHDPATYPELKAYLVRGGNPQSTFAIIRKLPGFELADAVDEAWKKAKFNEWRASNMCGIAAEFGHVDALETAANILRTADRDDYLSEAREALTKFTPASGDDPAILAWYDANRDKLVFDPQSKKFIVKPQS